MRHLPKILFTSFIALFASSLWASAAGTLDTTFGNGQGWVSTGFQQFPQSSRAQRTIQQADGKLVAAGYSNNGSNNDFALVRYNADGVLDASFGASGKVTTTIGSSDDQAFSVIQQADGKLVAAGYSNNGSNNDFALVRYNADGSLDTTFNSTGIVATAIGSGSDQAYSVLQQADGKLVAAGYSNNGSNNDFALVRYNTDGSLDTTFNSTGKVITAIGSGYEQATSVIQQADGQLVAAGYSNNGSNNDFALVRYNADGSLDTTFNSTGIVTTAIGSSNNLAYSVLQQADGQLVAAGYSTDGSGNTDFALVRYNADGTLDTTFNSTGKVTTAIGSSYEQAQTVVQQVDGKLVAAGYSLNGSNNDFALVRYNSDGSLDVTFNTTGKVTTAIGSSTEQAYSVIQQTDGQLVAAGYSYNSSSNYDFALARYNPDGTLDTTFNSSGKVTTAFYASNGQARSMIQQADGQLVAAGYSHIGSTDDFALVRYNTDGSLDTTFNSTGKVTTAIGSGPDQAYSVIQQTDGKLVAAGYSLNGSGKNHFALVRYNADGTLDTSFGAGGKVTTAIIGDGVALSVIQQADGKLVAAGTSYNGSNWDFALVRYNANGSLDTTFNGTGKVITDIYNSTDQATSVTQQADGKLVAAGFIYSVGDFALVRYNADGTLDTTFNNTGKVTTAIGIGADVVQSVIQQADGQLVAAGYSYNSGKNHFALVRYNADGTLDTSFGAGGKVTTAIIGGGVALSVIQQADGQLVAAGYSTDGSGNTDFALVRYNAEGTLDTTFNSTGKVTTAIGIGADVVQSVIQQADGKLAVAGYSTGMPTGQEFVVARYESGMCFAGQYWNGTACVDADAGSYVSSVGANSQTACGAETYQPLTGQSFCNTSTTCTLGSTFETVVPTLTSDRVCGGVVTTCTLGVNYETVAPTLTANRICSAYTAVSNCSTYDSINDACTACNPGFVLSGNVCLVDSDGDGIDNATDNCPLIPNANQLDYNGNSVGDACGDPMPMPADISGAIKADKAGSSVAFAGDVDGDGYGDYVIGIPRYDIPKTLTTKIIKDAGRAVVISGRTGIELMSVDGTKAKDAMGFSVAGNADIDGDGFPDVVVGAPKAGANNLVDAGTVTILHGGVTGVRKQIISGQVAKALFGSAVALGNVNNDGHADIIIGAPKDDDVAKNLTDAGSVSVINGNTLATTPIQTFYGTTAKAYAGTSVAAGEVDATTGADIIIGAPNDDDPVRNLKDTGSVAAYNIANSSVPLMKKYGAVAKAYLGKSVAAGDVNKDGLDEVLAGAPGDDNDKLKDVGSLTVFFANSVLPDHKEFGAVAKAGLGNSIAAGDVNGDDHADIIAGASKDDKPATPSAKTIKDVGSVTVWNGDGYTPIGTKKYGSLAKDYFGSAVSAGDVNSDGNDDLIIGVPGSDKPAVPPSKKVTADTGVVEVRSGL